MDYLDGIASRISGLNTAGIVILALGAVVSYAASAMYNRQRLSHAAMLRLRVPALAAVVAGAILTFI